MAVSCGADGEDMRSDILLFPLDALSDNFEIVDPKYVSFTPSPTTRKDLTAGPRAGAAVCVGLETPTAVGSLRTRCILAWTG